VPETRDPAAHGKFDIAGAALGALALAGISYALIEAPSRPASLAAPIVAGAVGVAAGCGFVLIERRRTRGTGSVTPMLPLDIFSSAQFSAVNAITFLVYGALGGLLFLLVLELQVVSGYSPLAAGAALLPITALLLTLSARSGAVAQRIGPRWLMTAGLTIAAIGMALTTRVGAHANYVADVLPAVAIFGLGMALTVAPLTATVLASADVRRAGVASGVNNAVARSAGLIAVAALPAAVGLGAASYTESARFQHGFDLAVVICALILLAGAALSGLLIDNNVLRAGARPQGKTNCPIGAPPLEPAERSAA
jgi:Na+/melibiose symporter-like transporter